MINSILRLVYNNPIRRGSPVEPAANQPMRARLHSQKTSGATALSVMLVGTLTLACARGNTTESTDVKGAAHGNRTIALLHGYVLATDQKLNAATQKQAVTGVSEQNTLKSNSSALSFSFSPDGQTIVVGNTDGTINLWQRDGKLIKTVQGHSGSVLYISFSPDGQLFASGGMDGTLKLWKRDGTLLKTLQEDYAYDVDKFRFSPDGKTIASIGAKSNYAIRVWELDGTPIVTLEGGYFHFNFSADGQTIVASGVDGKTTKLWTLDGKLIKQFQGFQSNVYYRADVLSSSDRQTIIAGTSGEGTIKLWKADGTLISTLNDGGYVTSVSLSPDGQTIASSSWDGTVKLWKLDGTLITTLKGLNLVHTASFSPDGQTIIAYDLDGTTKLWKRDGTPITTLKGIVTRASFSPDGQTIAGINNKNIKLWKIN